MDRPTDGGKEEPSSFHLATFCPSLFPPPFLAPPVLLHKSAALQVAIPQSSTIRLKPANHAPTMQLPGTSAQLCHTPPRASNSKSHTQHFLFFHSSARVGEKHPLDTENTPLSRVRLVSATGTPPPPVMRPASETT